MRDAFANGTGNAFGPFAVHGDCGRAVLEQRREFARMGSEHHGHGVTGQLDCAADDGMHEGTATDAHQLFGGAKSRGGARRQHHDVDMGGFGVRGIQGGDITPPTGQTPRFGAPNR